MPEHQTAEVQKVLDELWNEKLLPFELTVGKITKNDYEYIIHFHDSRISTANVLITESQPLSDSVRVAVLDRVARMSGPLQFKVTGA